MLNQHNNGKSETHTIEVVRPGEIYMGYPAVTELTGALDMLSSLIEKLQREDYTHTEKRKIADVAGMFLADVQSILQDNTYQGPGGYIPF